MDKVAEWTFFVKGGHFLAVICSIKKKCDSPLKYKTVVMQRKLVIS